ncbi:heme-degrading domain-containing protein [Lactiplantibacillus modestisalitolerans]|uniref:Heme-degrading domain-containing protein n=1 Tax=Lactiplantibacillus modestisalitolerans TaxID=1457219 RepID=A0ABV5WSS0_9LACO|nr:heme-degrading domain-containing protein [Lactiplantibacillus modestisalitolerans]
MLTTEEITQQEQQALLSHFNLADVAPLVESLREIGQEDFEKVCILITINKREVFFRAGTQTTHENNLWIQKKSNVVDAFDHSSLFEKAVYADDPDSFYKGSGLSPKDFAIVGGGFPIGIKNTGIIGSLIVSGLTDEGDHELAYKALLDLKAQQG